MGPPQVHIKAYAPDNWGIFFYIRERKGETKNGKEYTKTSFHGCIYNPTCVSAVF
jgi:hypothetical protein